MGILSKLNPFREQMDKALDLADQAVTDKDALHALRFSLLELRENVYVTELQTATIPWVDALHKMGRQIISLVSIAAIVVLTLAEVELSPSAMLALAGPGGVYNFVKGKGEADGVG